MEALKLFLYEKSGLGARLAELRHKASMGAFRESEWGDGGQAIPAEVTGAIEVDAAARSHRPAAFSGLGF